MKSVLIALGFGFIHTLAMAAPVPVGKPAKPIIEHERNEDRSTAGNTWPTPNTVEKKSNPLAASSKLLEISKILSNFSGPDRTALRDYLDKKNMSQTVADERLDRVLNLAARISVAREQSQDTTRSEQARKIIAAANAMAKILSMVDLTKDGLPSKILKDAPRKLTEEAFDNMERQSTFIPLDCDENRDFFTQLANAIDDALSVGRLSPEEELFLFAKKVRNQSDTEAVKLLERIKNFSTTPNRKHCKKTDIL